MQAVDALVGEAGNITLVLYDTGRIRTEHTLANNMEKIRDYILKQYNWNAIVKIMKFVSDHVNDFTYENPTNISGTTADNTLIIPDAGILAIAKHQLNTAIAAHNGEITAGNIGTLMRGVDGLPGNQFATSMMGETSQNTLRDEAGNTNMQREDGTDIEIPDFGSDSEETLYDFMRDLTLARNGLWSDEDSIVNLTGLRRELEISEAEDHKVQWNDTMAASWIETDEEGNEVKHCKHYTATTEPGNRDIRRMIAPQTATVLLGLHKNRQPAGRIQSPLIKGSDNDNNSYDFDKKNAAGMNIHPGGMTGLRGRINVGSTKNPLLGFPEAGGATSENSFADNLLLVELFHTLSKYGINWESTAYNYLKNERDSAIQINENERTEEHVKAISDYDKIEEILDDDSFTDTKINYIKNTIKFDSNSETSHLDGDNTTEPSISTSILNDNSFEVSEDISDSSHGCQVVYGGKNFYDYWWNVTNKAENSGQRRWYYTLIDISTPYNQIETQEIETNE